MDEPGKFLAQDGRLAWIRAGYGSEVRILDKAQDHALSAHSPIIAKVLGKKPAGPVRHRRLRPGAGARVGTLCWRGLHPGRGPGGGDHRGGPPDRRAAGGFAGRPEFAEQVFGRQGRDEGN